MDERAAGTLAATLAAGLLMIGCGDSKNEVTEGGPLQGAEVSSLGIPAQTSKPLTFSLPVIYNVGDSDQLTLDRVELDQPGSGLTLVGAMATGNSRQANYKDSDDDYPPTSPVYGKPRKLEGTKVPPVKTPAGEAGVELLVGVKASKDGRVTGQGLLVHYRDGDRRWRVRVPNAFALCAAAKQPNECEEPALPPRGKTKTGRKG